MLSLQLEHIMVRYGKRIILKDITVSFCGGEMVAVIGCNGAGKTTLLKALKHIVKYSGSVSLTDETGQQYPMQDIAYVPQLGAVETRLTVFEIVLLGLVRNLQWQVTREQAERVMAMLTKLGLESLSDRSIADLSGGQKQLVFMAQALVSEPKVLVLDEPTSALDLRHQLIVMDLARQYTEEHQAITLFVVHDLMLAARYSQRVLLLEHAGIRMVDIPEKVLKSELLENVYHVALDVERNRAGFFNVIPLRPI